LLHAASAWDTLEEEKLLEKIRHSLQKETGERLAHIQEEALKHNGFENAVRTVVEAAKEQASILG
jgi:hypothetical protein